MYPEPNFETHRNQLQLKGARKMFTPMGHFVVKNTFDGNI